MNEGISPLVDSSPIGVFHEASTSFISRPSPSQLWYEAVWAEAYMRGKNIFMPEG